MNSSSGSLAKRNEVENNRMRNMIFFTKYPYVNMKL